MPCIDGVRWQLLACLVVRQQHQMQRVVSSHPGVCAVTPTAITAVQTCNVAAAAAEPLLRAAQAMNLTA